MTGRARQTDIFCTYRAMIRCLWWTVEYNQPGQRLGLTREWAENRGGHYLGGKGYTPWHAVSMCPARCLCALRWMKRPLGLSAKGRFYAAQSEGVTRPLKHTYRH